MTKSNFTLKFNTGFKIQLILAERPRLRLFVSLNSPSAAQKSSAERNLCTVIRPIGLSGLTAGTLGTVETIRTGSSAAL